jgi:outer membrane protein assembly factor BamB
MCTGRRVRVAVAAMAAALVGLAGCSASPAEGGPGVSPPAGSGPAGSGPAGTPGGGSAPARPPATAPGDWPTYHRDNLRSGVAPGLPSVRSLSVAWRAGLDGAVYGQPLVVGGALLVGTENDTVYALDAASGRVRWSSHLGTPVPQSSLPCGNIDPLGITGTMVYDPATRLVFAVAETTGGAHTLFGLDVGSGAVRYRRAVEPPRGDREAHQQRAALTLLDGWVYIPYGGLAGDCARYVGTVIAAPTTGSEPLLSYAIPTSREGGIWAPGGGVVVGGRLLYAVGNGESTTSYDGSDSVIALDPQLRLVDRFWPTTWAQDNAQDADLGSMTPAPVGPYLLANGKAGIGYVLRPDHLGGQGGQRAQMPTCRPFGAAAVAGSTVYLPCADGTRALRVLSPDGRMVLVWQAPVPANGPPVVGGGLVWAVDYHAGVLYTLDPRTGTVRHHLDLGDVPHFASPTLGAGRAYIGTMSGVLAVAAG